MIKEEVFYIYHATDRKNAEKIEKEGFIYRYSPEHWLGNGIYFYQDYSLAKWWSSKPSKKFGVEINNPSILETEVFVDRKKLLDLRELEDYLEFTKIYRTEFLPKLMNGNIEIESFLLEFNTKSVELYFTQNDIKQIRCAFCDYLNEQYELDMIIGTFNLQRQPYLPREYGRGFKQFSLTQTSHLN